MEAGTLASQYRYHKVSPKFWSDRKVLAWDDDTRLLALYLLTCEHRTTEGLFRLPKAYIAADLGWTAERLAKPFAKLLDDGFVKYDEAVSVMLLTNALKWNPTENPNQAKAVLKSISELPETPLLIDFQQLAERFDKRLAEQLAERYGKPPTPSPTPSPTPLEDDDDNARAREEEQWSEFRQVFVEAYGGLPNSAHYEEIDGFLAEGMSLDAVIEAVRRAALNKAKGWSYVRRILQNWLKDGLLTLEQIHEHEEKRQTRTRASPPSPPQDGFPSWIDQELEKYRRIVEEQRRAQEAETA